MGQNDQDKGTNKLAGYAALIERYHLDVIPNWLNRKIFAKKSE